MAKKHSKPSDENEEEHLIFARGRDAGAGDDEFSAKISAKLSVREEKTVSSSQEAPSRLNADIEQSIRKESRVAADSDDTSPHTEQRTSAAGDDEFSAKISDSISADTTGSNDSDSQNEEALSVRATSGIAKPGGIASIDVSVPGDQEVPGQAYMNNGADGMYADDAASYPLQSRQQDANAGDDAFSSKINDDLFPDSNTGQYASSQSVGDEANSGSLSGSASGSAGGTGSMSGSARQAGTDAASSDAQAVFMGQPGANAGDDAFSSKINKAFSLEARKKRKGSSILASQQGANAESASELEEQERAAANAADADEEENEEEKVKQPSFVREEEEMLKAKEATIKGLMSTTKAKVGFSLMGIIGIVVAVAFFFGSSMVLIMFKENVLGKGNSVANSRLERHLAKSAGRTFKKMHDDVTFADKFSKPKFQAKMEKAGFNVGWDDDSNTLRSLTYEYVDADGATKTRAYDFSKPVSAASKDFFRSDQASYRMLNQYNKATYGTARAWRMGAAERVHKAYNIRFTNMFDGKVSEKAKTAKQKFADLLRKNTPDPEATVNANPATTPVTDDDARSLGWTDKEIADWKALNGEFTDDPDTRKPLGVDKEAVETSRAIGDELRSDPTKTFEQVYAESHEFPLADVDRQNMDDSINRATDTTSIGDIAREGISKAPSVALGAVAGSLNLAGSTADACALVGAMSYAQHVKSTAMALQLMDFGYKWMTVPDHQKSNLITTQGLKIALQAAQDRSSSSGKDFFSSGAIQYEMGDLKARPSPSNLAAYSTGRSNEGTLAKIYEFVTTTPPFDAATSPRTCKVATNGFVTFGGTVVGAVAAFFSGGSSAIVNTTIRLTMMGVRVVALTYIEQMIIKSAIGMPIDGLSENGEQMGDAAGSGIGVAKATINNANGLRPISVDEFEAATAEAEQYQQFAMSQYGFFDRYLGFRGDSLLGSMVLNSSQMSSLFSAKSLLGNASLLFSPSKTLLATSGSVTGMNTAYAASSPCNDERIKERNLASSPTCSLIMAGLPDLDVEETTRILKQNGDIDEDENPVSGSEYEKYRAQCLSGRIDVLVEDIGDADTDDIMNGRVNPNKATSVCLASESGPTSLDGKNYPGGAYDRFAVQHATKNQEDGIIKAINDDFGVASSTDFEASDTDQTADGDAADAARKILELEQQGKISFLDWKDTSDRSNPVQNLHDIAEGGKAKTTQHRTCTNNAVNARNKSTNVDAKLLNFIVELAETSGQIVKINALAGQCHSATSKHYDGTAVDFGCPFDPNLGDRIGQKYGVSRYAAEDCTPARGNHYHYSTSGY